ncbi:MAG: ribonuclease III [Bacteroidales bacterium]|nr:ribonuclease III [Bacteroidales bacterium]MDD4384024.1 ribonuclease III [Bacteroidales bacterium]MDY0198478.1 ribonuclease III [Tenuifilaceae bacterium]
MIRRFLGFKRKLVNASDKAFFSRLRKEFGINATRLDLYNIAIIHKSASTIVSKGKKVNNERLEYLGDAILDAIITDFLFTNFPNKDEGFLTKMRSRIVSRQSLNCIALAIGLDKIVVTQTNNPLAHKHIFGDALEAFVGAIFLDKGYSYTSQWVTKFILTHHVDLNELQVTESDYKSRVIELAQKYKYEVLFDSQESESSKGQSPVFESKLYLNQKLLGSGFGTSKKEAEQIAAMVALERIDIISLPLNPVKPQTINWEN